MCGKTTIAKNVLTSNARWIVYDLLHEYDDRVHNAVVIYCFEDLQQLLRLGEPRIIFRPKTDRVDVFELFCAHVWVYAKHLTQARNYLVWVSEIRQVMKQAGVYALSIINRGRHFNLALCGDSQRILNLDKDYIGNVNVFYIGRIFLPNELRYLEEFVPDDVMQKLRELKRYHFVRYIPNPDEFDLPESERVVIVENKAAELAKA